MSFALALEDGRLIVEHIAFESGMTALLYLGADIERGATYHADVSLTGLPGGGRHEFTFFILARDVETGEETAYWNGQHTKRLIPQPFRREILRHILSAAAHLIAAVQPVRVQIVTHDPHLPRNALRKYYVLLWAFRAAGYKITVCDPYDGYRLWYADRPDS